MSGPARVRELRRDDVERVAAIAASLKDAPRWPVSAYEAALDAGASPRRLALVAEDAESGVVAGFAVASVVMPEAELETIAVAAEAQRRGMGRQLLAALVEGLRGMGVEVIQLEVRAGNGAAMGLYRLAGFEETGCRRGYYADPVEDAVLMTLRVD